MSLLEYSANIDYFFSTTTKVISDIEGNDVSFGSVGDIKILIGGDMLDSTGFTPDVFKTQIFNLRNIERVLFQPDKYELILGNRDLNKFKCKFMCHLNDYLSNEHINNFNLGQINYDYLGYENLKASILTSSYVTVPSENGEKKKKIQKPIWASNIESWYTFWADFKLLKPDGSTSGNGRDWYIPDSDTENSIFLNRFNAIFGRDNAVGTMSAQNLIDAIPLELGINFEGIPAENLQDYKAFIVLAIFKSMCTKKTDDIPSGPQNTKLFRGWLCSLYTAPNVKFVAYYNKDDYLYMFSHGGISKNIIVNDVDKVYKFMESNVEMTNRMANINFGKFDTGGQLGGFYKISTDLPSLSRVQICEKLDKINDFYKNVIKRVMDCETYNIPNLDCLFLLATSAPFNVQKFNTKFGIPVPTNYPNFILESPIQSGIEGMRNNAFFCSDHAVGGANGVNVVQFVGHKPKGYTGSVDFYEKQENDKTFLSFVVSLDISNSLTNKPTNRGSHIFVIFERYKFPIITSFIKMTVSEGDCGKYNNDTFASEINRITTTKSPDLKIYYKSDCVSNEEINNGILINLNISDPDTVQYLKKMTFATKEIYYGGFTSGSVDECSKHHHLTYLLDGDSPPFRSTFLILNETDFDTFNEKLSQIQAQIQAQALVGGSKPNKYYSKFLKYKQKSEKLTKVLS